MNDSCWSTVNAAAASCHSSGDGSPLGDLREGLSESHSVNTLEELDVNAGSCRAGRDVLSTHDLSGGLFER